MYRSETSHRVDRRQRGSVLVLVLIVLSSLVALATGLAYRTRIEVKLAQAAARRVQAYHLARGGIERVRVLLSRDELSPDNLATMWVFSETAKNEELFDQLALPWTSQVRLAYGLCDEQGFLHVNKSDPAGWERIATMTRESTAAILDWIDPDDSPGPGGAESDFYARLDPPYVAKSKPCVVLRELLFIRDIDHLRYVGAGAGAWFAGADGGASAWEAAGAADAAAEIGLIDTFTVYGDGKVNINTAPGEVLTALQGLDEEAVDALLGHRAGPDGLLGTEDDRAIASAEQLAEVEGLSALHVDLLKTYCGYTSTFFRVMAFADAGDGSICGLMASVQVLSGKSTLLSMERLF